MKIKPKFQQGGALYQNFYNIDPKDKQKMLDLLNKKQQIYNKQIRRYVNGPYPYVLPFAPLGATFGGLVIGGYETARQSLGYKNPEEVAIDNAINKFSTYLRNKYATPKDKSPKATNKFSGGGEIPPETEEIEIRKPYFTEDNYNMEKLYEYSIPYRQTFHRAGITNDNLIAGILGNIAQESSFNPNISATYKGKIYRGLIQNEPIIYNYIRDTYGNYSRNTQIQYIIDGLKGKLRKPKNPQYNQIYEDLTKRFNNFNNAYYNNPETAALNWEQYYEKSTGKQNAKRARYARYFYNGYMAPTPKGFDPNSIKFH